MIELFGWTLTVLSIVGKFFVIEKRTAGMYMWAVSNIGWIVYHLHHESYPAAFLFAVYFLICIHGIIKWTGDKDG